MRFLASVSQLLKWLYVLLLQRSRTGHFQPFIKYLGANSTVSIQTQQHPSSLFCPPQDSSSVDLDHKLESTLNPWSSSYTAPGKAEQFPELCTQTRLMLLCTEHIKGFPVKHSYRTHCSTTAPQQQTAGGHVLLKIYTNRKHTYTCRKKQRCPKSIKNSPEEDERCVKVFHGASMHYSLSSIFTAHTIPCVSPQLFKHKVWQASHNRILLTHTQSSEPSQTCRDEHPTSPSLCCPYLVMS